MSREYNIGDRVLCKPRGLWGNVERMATIQAKTKIVDNYIYHLAVDGYRSKYSSSGLFNVGSHIFQGLVSCPMCSEKFVLIDDYLCKKCRENIT